MRVVSSKKINTKHLSPNDFWALYYYKKGAILVNKASILAPSLQDKEIENAFVSLK